ncbi:MAG: hypothetical protein RIT26_117 [Pseudomonadota bacterium]|jgi:dCTP deaminase
MVLSNSEIVEAIKAGHFAIEGLPTLDPSEPPFNTSAVDLKLADELVIPNDFMGQLDLSKKSHGGIASHWNVHSSKFVLSADQPFSLKRNQFVLGNTVERVDFSVKSKTPSYAARVEGKSSLARCGMLVHFTAPTIHTGFKGKITLEIINLGPSEILLKPGMPICQLIIEEVKGVPVQTPGQFINQHAVVGVLP